MAELWPASLRASGFGLVYGVSNIGKFIGPAGLALIAGASNYVSPKATLAAIVPAFNYFAVWYLLAVFAFLFIGIETRGRTIEELDAALVGGAQAAAAGWERIRADPRSTSQNGPNRGGRALLRNLPQIGDQIGEQLVVLDAWKGHAVAGNKRPGVEEIFGRGVVVPDDGGRLHRRANN